MVYTITNLQMTLTPTWLSCYTFGELTFNSLYKGMGRFKTEEVGSGHVTCNFLWFIKNLHRAPNSKCMVKL